MSESRDTKVCLLTGASGTIGYAIAQALKSSDINWHIIIIGRRSPPASITDVDGKPPAVLPYDTFLQVTDMTDESAVCTMLDTHFEALEKDSPELRSDEESAAKKQRCAENNGVNKLDLLVNCAGCSLGNKPIVDVSADTFRTVMEVNLIVPFILSKWAMKKMATPAGGRIINIGSIASESPRLNSIPYTTSKYALSGLSRCLSVEGRFLSQTTKSTEAGNGVVAVCQVNPGNVRSAILSPEELARREKEEGFVEPGDIGKYIAMVAGLPNEANVLESTVMPTRQPLVGRG